MKRKIIIFIVTIILLLIAFSIYHLVTSVKQDKEITEEKMQQILIAYESFNTAIQDFAKKREEYYKSLENAFLEEFANKYNDWNNLITNYEKSIENVENSSEVLKENCIVQFADVNVNSKCTTFKANYEAAMNYYINDIKNYNKTVNEYNTWVSEGGYNYGKLNKGKFTIYEDYIDFDKDGEYFGKEESSNEQ